MPDIILIGGGGHCVSCIEAIESVGQWQIVGILDVANRRGETVLGYEIIGTDEAMPAIAKRIKYAIITVGHIATTATRKRLFEAAVGAGFELPVICASTGYVSRHSDIGDGSIIMHHATVNARVSIGKNCIINTGAIIEHDAIVGSHCHVSTGAIVNGGCNIGDGSFIGSGAVLKHGIRIEAGCVIGAGATVTHDLAETGTYVGCPARRLR